MVSRFGHDNVLTLAFHLVVTTGGKSSLLSTKSGSFTVVFTFYIIFVVFGVLNVLTGVFLESATEFLDKDLVIQAQMMRADQFVSEMNNFFKEFDTDDVGQISWSQFEACMDNEEVLAYLASHQLEIQDAYTLFQLLDRDGQQHIDINKFIQGCLRLKGAARSIDSALMLREQDRLKSRMLKLQDYILDIGREMNLGWDAEAAGKTSMGALDVLWMPR